MSSFNSLLLRHQLPQPWVWLCVNVWCTSYILQHLHVHFSKLIEFCQLTLTLLQALLFFVWIPSAHVTYFYWVEVWRFCRCPLPENAHFFKKSLCCTRSMFGVIISHEVMAVRVDITDEWLKSLIQDLYIHVYNSFFIIPWKMHIHVILCRLKPAYM